MIIYLRNLCLTLLAAYLSIVALIPSSFAETSEGNAPQKNKHIRILSIDGGGIRGIIPALVLKNLESRLKKGRHLTDCFDIMTGTSTGGIIVLLLNTPDERGKPKYQADHILKLYLELGNKVFKNSIWQNVKSGAGWWGAKYSEKSLEQLLSKYFGNTQLKDTLSNVSIPAYEIEKDQTFFFHTHKARKTEEGNYLLKDIARATSAAPGYFKPAQINNILKTANHVFIDGGISVNNPTLSAAVYTSEIYGIKTPFFIVSLGTGTNYGAKSKYIARGKVANSGFLGWAKKIIPTMMYAVNAVTDYEMRYTFNYNNPHTDYFRFQPIIESEHGDLDNISEENLNALKRYAERIIKDNDQTLQEIADVLNEDRNVSNN